MVEIGPLVLIIKIQLFRKKTLAQAGSTWEATAEEDGSHPQREFGANSWKLHRDEPDTGNRGQRQKLYGGRPRGECGTSSCNVKTWELNHDQSLPQATEEAGPTSEVKT